MCQYLLCFLYVQSACQISPNIANYFKVGYPFPFKKNTTEKLEIDIAINMFYKFPVRTPNMGFEEHKGKHTSWIKDPGWAFLVLNKSKLFYQIIPWNSGIDFTNVRF